MYLIHLLLPSFRQATNKFFTMDENFSLGNLLELELHK